MVYSNHKFLGVALMKKYLPKSQPIIVFIFLVALLYISVKQSNNVRSSMFTLFFWSETTEFIFSPWNKKWSYKSILFFSTVLYPYLCSYAIGKKIHKHVGPSYTRKFFHLSIFLAAGLLLLFGSINFVILFGLIVTMMVYKAVKQGKGNALYDALARKSDYPHEAFFIMLSMIMTALGGLMSYFLFGRMAILGILVVGLGDAAAEIIGKKWGAHPFKAPSLRKVPCSKTMEGSLSIAFVSFFIATIFFLHVGFLLSSALIAGGIIGVAAAFVEAWSYHGTDNLLVQLTTAALANLCVSLLSST
jgi:phytol kinase